MPYAVVETVDAAGDTKLLTVPEQWLVVCEAEGVEYLRWPDAKSVRHIKSLLADDLSRPEASWEKHKCTVIYRDIASILVAQQTLKIIQQHRKTGDTVGIANSSTPIVAMNPAVIHAGTIQSSGNGQGMSVRPSTTEERDPFHDVDSAPPMLQQQGPSHSASRQYQENDPFEDIGKFEDLIPQNVSSVEKDGLPTVVDTNEPGYVEMMHTNKNVENDPAQDVKLFPQLYDMILELKSMMKANQEEIRQKLAEGFSQLQTAFKTWTEQSVHKPQGQQTSYDPVDYEVYGLASIEEVKGFDERLKDAEFRQGVHKWIDSFVSDVESSWNRMKKMMIVIFSQKCVLDLSTTGSGGLRYPILNCLQILNLFKYIGTTSRHQVNDGEVRDFFIKRIKYAKDMETYSHTHAPSKKKNAKLRTIAPSLRLSVEEVCEDETMMELDESMEQIEMMKEQNGKRMRLDSIEQQRESSSKEGSLPTVVGGNLPDSNHVFPLKTLDDMNAFEVRLCDERELKHTQLWIDQNLHYDTKNVEDHMKTLLERLVDKNVLLNFCWIKDTGGGKRSLAEYKHFVGLFHYVREKGTYVQDQGCVSNFFTEVLDHVS
ncbi:uncharacterized protein LOC120904447 [Anopheles arabiensis]|nr:uncharacterized protein LOC120904447 [Anopheles arabiensis]XP_040170350.1 uncharacterized protein LOC120904447 [Anopheles arabiensis]